MSATPATIAVLLPLPVADGVFDYALPEGEAVQPGDIVAVPFGNRVLKGVVWGEGSGQVPLAKLKPIREKILLPPMGKALREFIDWVAEYTLSPRGAVLKMAISVQEALVSQAPEVAYIAAEAATARLSASRQKVLALLADHTPRTIPEIVTAAGVSKNVVQGLIESKALQAVTRARDASASAPLTAPLSSLTLSPEQYKAATQIIGHIDAQEHRTILIDGITGSGKTEVYFAAIEAVLQAEKGQVLILLPEIILTSQLLMRFEQRFGFRPAQWHSAMTPKQRRDTWRKLITGEERLVIGARSALFLPFASLRLIVVDEEHEAAFKQEDGVIYHARDMAIVRAMKEQIPIILASATPSVETMLNVRSGKYDHVALSSRYGEAVLPEIQLIDMRRNPPERGTWLSPPLKQALAETLLAGQQSMLFLNRRGYAPLTLCRSCGHRLQCPQCSSWLVEHKHISRLQCHHCGFATRTPKECPDCKNSETFVACGPGVERIEEEVRAALPQARTLMVTSDTIATANDATAVMQTMLTGGTDIIIGTQMIAKGHHFPRLTLVGVVDGDLGLAGGDLRASERTYQLLHQVSGRAGREKDRGRVLIQSYLPEHPVMQALANCDRERFLQLEIEGRELCEMPPFSRLAALILMGRDEMEVLSTARQLVKIAPVDAHVEILGPAAAPITLLRGQYRYRILVKTPKNLRIQTYLRHWLAQLPMPSTVRLKVDVDPYSFM